MKALALASVFACACATLGREPVDPARAAADAHRVSVEACRAYHAAVALGAPANAEAETACKVAQGVCSDE